jgi:hypothetical protein
MRRILMSVSVVLAVAAVPADCLAWGAITHAHLANRLGERRDIENLQEMYGSTITDMFNIATDSPYSDLMYDCMHYRFERIRPYACTTLLEAAMTGIASHNDAWGADWTAHHRARSLPEPIGYVIYKAEALAPALEAQLADLLGSAGAPDAAALAHALAPDLAHNFVETAVDLLISRNEDPLIGYRLLVAAQLRGPGIPLMVARAFAGDLSGEFGVSRLEAWLFILGVEREYRELMTMYGGIFTRGFDEAVALLAEQGALYAEAILEAAAGVPVTVPPDLVGAFLVEHAIPAVRDDYGREIALTCAYLEERLDEEGYTSIPALPLAKSEPRAFETIPSAPRLDQNRPNPFNPSTEICYHVPESAQVRLAVFDAAGRLVDVLVDARVAAGEHTATWNGSDSRGNAVGSGVYFCRFTCGGRTVTRKMILLR